MLEYIPRGVAKRTRMKLELPLLKSVSQSQPIVPKYCHSYTFCEIVFAKCP